MTYEKRPTQENQILNYLLERKGERVEAYRMVYDLWILQYSARICWLRKKGHEIENKIEMKKNKLWYRVKAWFFRIIIKKGCKLK